MKKVYVKINPMDTLFFRTGKPFSGGEVNWTTSNPFPAPSVLWGAVYSMLISHGQITKPKDEIQKVKLRQVYLLDSENLNLYLPAPLDLYKIKNNKVARVLQLEARSNTVLSNSALMLDTEKDNYTLVVGKRDRKKQIEGLKQSFINVEVIKELEYINQLEYHDFGVKSASDFLKSNPKVGIKREATTRLNEDGMLYRIDSAEYKDKIGFLVELLIEDTITFPQNGYLKIGGESKAATFEIVEENEKYIESIHSEEKVVEKKGIHRVLITAPTCFESGNGVDEFEKNGLLVKAACIGKPIKIGGFDVAKNQPKSMYNHVPSGSVYFVEEIEPNENLSLIDRVQQTIEITYNGFNQFVVLPTAL